MSCIRVSVKTEAPEALKFLNHLNSYMFEQECGELSGLKESQKETLKKATRLLSKIVSGKT